MSFHGKVAIVTGGGTGIGAEAARQLVAGGASVVINGRRADALERTTRAIGLDHVVPVAGDIGDPATARRVVEAAQARFGRVDVLLNNAGYFAPKPFLEHTEADYDGFVATILKGRFFMAQAAARAMIAGGRGGAIVNTGSMWALQAVGETPSSAYSAGYGGVHALTKNLAIELAAHGIRVNAVAPAVVETPVYETFMTPDVAKEVLAGFNGFHPLGRNGQPADVASALLFLASDEASWITGAILPVDGGVMAGPHRA
jgi:NAD(P)-dependent dehydrogenase (short-subunit alcohol dehydrogenase family)